MWTPWEGSAGPKVKILPLKGWTGAWFRKNENAHLIFNLFVLKFLICLLNRHLKTIRIIPRLDIKGPNLVKGIHLEGLRVLGKPEDFARLYSEQGADELFFQDTVASLYQRNNLTDIVSRTADNIFIPLTVGGGIRSLEDINRVLRAGADKVAINTAAIANPISSMKQARLLGRPQSLWPSKLLNKPTGTT